MTRASLPRIAIAGAGIIGLGCALELARRGAPVTLYDPNTPGRGASWAAAGMIAPAFEAAAENGVHPRLFDLCLQGARLWTDFAARLERDAGVPLGYSPGPSLAIATNAEAAGHLAAIAARLELSGIPGDRLTPAEACAREPALSPHIASALSLPTDGHVNNRAVVTALLKLCMAHPDIAIEQRPAPIRASVMGVSVDDHDLLLVTAGWQSAVLKVEEHGREFSLVNWDAGLDGIDCYGGQMLSVTRGPDGPVTTLRAGHVYMVPRGDELVIGATMEPGRTDDMPDDAAIADLKAKAAGIVPCVADAEITSTWAGVRPGTPDHAPFLGRTRQPNMFIAAGHYRNGILLAPITAQIMAGMILDGETSPLAAAFALDRPLPALASGGEPAK